MAFTVEPNYFNRYDKNSRYFQWRALAGETRQSAEDNEVISLFEDLVQRIGDSDFQNGDVLYGMLATPTGTSGNQTLYRVDRGACYLDGVMHDVPGGVRNLGVPTTGWGFIGVYLRKDLITSTDPTYGQSLRDPAVHDQNGNPLGLPGCDRLQITPTWIAGPLPVSDFDDNRIASLLTTQNSASGYAGRMTVAVDTLQPVSSNSIFNGKITWPNTSLTDITQVQAYLNPQQYPITARLGMTISASATIANAGSGSITCQVNLFGAGGSLLTIPSADIQTVSTSTGNVTVNLTHTLTSADITALGTQYNQVGIGIIFSSTVDFPVTTIFYVTDYLASMVTDLRRPAYRLFTNAYGIQYRNYTPGASNLLIHGTAETTGVGNNSQPAQPTSLNGVAITAVPVPSSLTGVDPVIRQSVVTPPENITFETTYGMLEEDGLNRIYPVHITYNGNIISTLENRQFTSLTDDYLSGRLQNIAPDAVVSGLELTAISDGLGGYLANTIAVTPGKAFVKGRMFAINNPPNLSLPTSYPTQVQPNPSESQDYTGPSTSYVVAAGSFVSIDDAEVSVLFKETVTHVQSTTTNAFAIINPPALTQLDVLTEVSYSVQSVQDSSNVYVEGLDWDMVSRVDTSGNPKTVVGWYNSAATSTTRASIQPALGATYTVYYMATFRLVTPASGSTSSVNMSYVISQNTNVGFNILSTNSTAIDGITVLQLIDGFTNPSSTTLLGPFLCADPGYLIGDGSQSSANSYNNTLAGTVAKSLISVYAYTVQNHDAFIIYLSGDVTNDGPDGIIGYQSVPSDTSSQQIAKASLMTQKKLPLGITTTPVSPTSITNYSLRQITLVEQQQVNQSVDALNELMPALLSEAMLAGDYTVESGQTFYEAADVNYSEDQRLDTYTWTIDGVAYPPLSGYTAKIQYGYYGDGEIAPTGTTFPTDQTALIGLIRDIVVTISDSGGKVVRTVVVTYGYDSNSRINDSKVQVT